MLSSTEQLTEQSLDNLISEENVLRLNKSVSALEKVFNDLMRGDMSFEDFTFLNENKTKVLELCGASEDLLVKQNHLRQIFDKREEEKTTYVDFLMLFSDLWSYCEDKVEGTAFTVII